MIDKKIKEQWGPHIKILLPEVSEYQLNWMYEYFHNLALRENNECFTYKLEEHSKYPSLLPLSMKIIKNTPLLSLIPVKILNKKRDAEVLTNETQICPDVINIPGVLEQLEQTLINKVSNFLNNFILDNFKFYYDETFYTYFKNVKKLLYDKTKFMIAAPNVASDIEMKAYKKGYSFQPFNSFFRIMNLDIYVDNRLKNDMMIIGNKPEFEGNLKIELYSLAETVYSKVVDNQTSIGIKSYFNLDPVERKDNITKEPIYTKLYEVAIDKNYNIVDIKIIN